MPRAEADRGRAGTAAGQDRLHQDRAPATRKDGSSPRHERIGRQSRPDTPKAAPTRCGKRPCASWCPGSDSNRHASRRGILSPLRLPVSPPGLTGRRASLQSARQRTGGDRLAHRKKGDADCWPAMARIGGRRSGRGAARTGRSTDKWPRPGVGGDLAGEQGGGRGTRRTNPVPSASGHHYGANRPGTPTGLLQGPSSPLSAPCPGPCTVHETLRLRLPPAR